MPSKVASLLLLVCSSTTANNAAFKVTPVEKVIALLTKLDAQVVADGQKEAAQYDNYACFCKEQGDQKKYMIDKSTVTIARQGEEISKLGTKIDALNQEISNINKQIVGLVQDITKLDTQRKIFHQNYLYKDDHITVAIQAVVGAIKALNDSKAQMSGDVDLDSRSESFLQLKNLFSTSTGLVHSIGMSALSEMRGSPPAGQAAAYQYQSNTKVIAVLQKLRKTFLGIKNTQDGQEFDSNAVFENDRSAKVRTKKFSEVEKAETALLASQKSKVKADTEAEQLQETNEKDSDEKFLAVMVGDCQTKAEQWDQRSKSRSEELTAINDAKTVLVEGKSKGASGAIESVSESYRSNQKLVPASFLQLRGTRSAAALKAATERVHNFLAQQAESISSPTLSLLSVKVSGVEDRFVKVRALIKDLMKRLVDDAKSEATRKQFCDTEVTKAIKRRDASIQSLEQAESSIAELSAKKANREQTIREQSEDKANSLAAKLKATTQRTEETGDNDRTKLDAQAGKAAVASAIAILQKYYASLLQVTYTPYVPPDSDREGKTVSDRAPEIWSGEYTGRKHGSTGIIGLLEVILADFDRTITATGAVEVEQQTAFATFEGATDANILANQALIDSNTVKITTIDSDMMDRTSDKKAADQLRDGANGELDDLKSSCVDGEENFAQRAAKREKEIDALKRALVILDEWQN